MAEKNINIYIYDCRSGALLEISMGGGGVPTLIQETDMVVICNPPISCCCVFCYAPNTTFPS